MDTEIKAAIQLLKKHKYRVSKIPTPKGTPDIHIFLNGAFGAAANEMIKAKVKNLTVRKIMLKTIKTKLFNDCLDGAFKGKKREEFDSIQEKKYNISKTLVQDLMQVGKYKRFKLLERAIHLDMNAVRTLIDPDYRPAGDKVVVRKRKYKKS
jgi:hypothetical protein